MLCSSSWRRRAGDHPGSLPRTSSVGFLALRSGRCRSGCCALWLVSLSPFPGLLAFDFPPSSRSLGMPQGGLGGGVAVSSLPRVSNAVSLHSAVSCPGGRLPSRFFLPLSRQSKVLRFIIIIIFIFQRRGVFLASLRCLFLLSSSQGFWGVWPFTTGASPFLWVLNREPSLARLLDVLLSVLVRTSVSPFCPWSGSLLWHRHLCFIWAYYVSRVLFPLLRLGGAVGFYWPVLYK